MPDDILLHHAEHQPLQGSALALAHGGARRRLEVEALKGAARAVMQHADVAFAGLEDCGHLDHAAVEHVDQQQHRAGPRRQRFQRDQQRIGDLLGPLEPRLGRLIVGRHRVVTRGSGRFHRRRQPRADVGAPLAAAQTVDAEIGRDAKQPSLEVGTPHRRARLHGAREGLLHEVVRVGGHTRHAIAQAPETPFAGAERSFDVGGGPGHGGCITHGRGLALQGGFRPRCNGVGVGIVHRMMRSRAVTRGLGLGSALAALVLIQGCRAVEVGGDDASVVFVCRNGVAMSVWSAAYFNQLAEERGIRARAVARAAIPSFQAVPLRMRFALAVDGYRLDGFVPRVVSPADLATAGLVVAIDTPLPEDVRRAARSPETWDGFPPMREQYFPSRTALMGRVEALVERLATRSVL